MDSANSRLRLAWALLGCCCWTRWRWLLPQLSRSLQRRWLLQQQRPLLTLQWRLRLQQQQRRWLQSQYQQQQQLRLKQVASTGTAGQENKVVVEIER